MEMRLIIPMSLFCNIASIHSLTCPDILEMPADKSWTLSELQTILPKDMIECLAHLGKEQLPSIEAEFIWQSIKNFYEGIENIPDSVLIILHWVTPAIKPEEYGNITLDNIDVIENFGFNYNLNREQLAAIAERVRENFAGKEPEDYTYYDLMALKQILCQFNRSEIERIHPSAYREAALMIGKLENCDAEPMAGFATLALDPSAFGQSGWTETAIKTMGKVADFLPQYIKARFKVGSDKMKSKK